MRLKTILMVSSILLILLITSSASGENYVGKHIQTCEHSIPDNIRSDVPATCTEWGYTSYLCVYKGCKGVRIFYTTEPGHKWGNPIKVEPTCTERGYDYVKCTACGERKSYNFVDAKGHLERVVEKEATCYSTRI